MFNRFLRLCLAIAAATTFGSAIAADQPKAAGGSFAANSSAAVLPLNLDTSRWNSSTNSGTLSATYTNYPIRALNYDLQYSGNWSYTGGVDATGLNGKLLGSWQIAGIVAPPYIPAGTAVSAQIDATFANGTVSGTLTVTLPAIGTLPIPLSQIGIINQNQALGLLLAN